MASQSQEHPHFNFQDFEVAMADSTANQGEEPLSCDGSVQSDLSDVSDLSEHSLEGYQKAIRQQEALLRDQHEQGDMKHAHRTHCLEEFELAKFNLHKLVEHSLLFPQEVAQDDWLDRKKVGHSSRRHSEQITRRSSGHGTRRASDQDSQRLSARSNRDGGQLEPSSISERELSIGELLGRGGFCEIRLARKQSCGEESQLFAMKYLSPAKMDSSPNAEKNSHVFQGAISDLALEARFLAVLSHQHIIQLHHVCEGNLEDAFDCDIHFRKSRHRRPQFGYFLLLDPLAENLTDRIDRTFLPQVLHSYSYTTRQLSNPTWWKRLLPDSNQRKISHVDNAPQQQHQPSTDNTDSKTASPQVLLATRLKSLQGIASALQYLHEECKVVFRDIKPDNIGFYRKYHSHCHCGYVHHQSNKGASACNTDSEVPKECQCFDDIPKLFDFGLAKELKSQQKYVPFRNHNSDDITHGVQEYCAALTSQVNLPSSSNDTFKLTPCTGSRRYMAPEVALSHPYNHKADVYSFGLVLYQVASLITPFHGYSIKKHERDVLRLGKRPLICVDSSTRPKTSRSQTAKQSKVSIISRRRRHSAVRIDHPAKPNVVSSVAKTLSESIKSSFRSQFYSKSRDQEDVPGGGDEANEQGEDGKRVRRRSSITLPASFAIRENDSISYRIKQVWPQSLINLIEDCWDGKHDVRPQMSDVIVRLDECIEELLSSDANDTEDHSRQSSNVSTNDADMDARNTPVVRTKTTERKFVASNNASGKTPPKPKKKSIFKRWSKSSSNATVEKHDDEVGDTARGSDWSMS